MNDPILVSIALLYISLCVVHTSFCAFKHFADALLRKGGIITEIDVKTPQNDD